MEIEIRKGDVLPLKRQYLFHIAVASTPVVDSHGEAIGTAMALLNRPALSQADLDGLKEKLQAEADRMLGERYDYVEMAVDNYMMAVPDDVVERIRSDAAGARKGADA